MKVFVTGATGYIGGSVAVRLVADGHQVRGLTRDPAKVPALSEAGIDAVIGALDDAGILARETRNADAVINAADADHRAAVEAILAAAEGTGTVVVHTSGSSLVGDDAKGHRLSESIYDETTPMSVGPGKRARHELNSMILDSATRGVHSVIICPSLVYGVGAGINPMSIQVPFLVDQARAAGVVRVIGQGLNRWSTVHIDDLSDLYSRALGSAPVGAFYFAENGEASFADIGSAIADRLGLDGIHSWDADEAATQWGPARAYYTFGSNSRVRALRAREELGWRPHHSSVLNWIREEMPDEDEEDKR